MTARGGRRPSIWTVALAIVLGMQGVRVLFPLLFRFGEQRSYIGAGVFALVVFTSPVLAPAIRRAAGARRALLGAIAGLAALRLAIQVVHPIPLWLATAAVVAALLAWTLLLLETRAGGDGVRFFAGLLLGLTLDTGIRSAALTWDLAWREGLVPLGVTVLLAGALVASVGTSTGGGPGGASDGERGPSLRLALFGPFLMLQVLFLQSPPFVASQAGISLPAAVAVVLAGNVLALASVARVVAHGTAPASRSASMVGLVVAGAALPHVVGPTSVVMVLVAQATAGTLLAAALAVAGRPGGRALGWDGLAFGLGTLEFALLVLLYQIHYELPLPFPNTALPAVAAIALALNRDGRPVPDAKRGVGGLAAVPAALLVVPLVLWLAWPDAQMEPRARNGIRVVNYNIHLGVDTEGQLDPEAIAREIRAEEPDVVILQEVGRGWAIGGVTDLAEWLAWRLRMPYEYRGAADRQFGNAVFSRVPVTSLASGDLPLGTGPQRRSYLQLTLDLGPGLTIDVIGTHLQHQERPETRLQQVEALLEAWDGASPSVIAGDMNAQPDDPEIDRLLDAGLLSAQDQIGDPRAPTVPIPQFPGDRIDYVFGTGVIFRDFAIRQTNASDHLPLAVTVEPR